MSQRRRPAEDLPPMEALDRLKSHVMLFLLLDRGLLVQFWSFAEFHPVLSKFKGKVHRKIDAQCPPTLFFKIIFKIFLKRCNS